MADSEPIPLTLRPALVSTCPDFVEERSFLHKEVFPDLNKLCQTRGLSFCPVDLQLGSRDELAESDDLIQLSLDYVTQGAPFLICLVGERYGPHIAPLNSSRQGSRTGSRPGSKPGSRAGSRRGSITDLTNPMPIKFSTSKPPSRTGSQRNLNIGGCIRHSSIFSGHLAGASNIHWLRSAAEHAALSGYLWLRNSTYENASLLELQIIHAAYVSGFENCRFYFRVPGHVDDLYPETVSPVRRNELLRVYESENEYAKARVEEMKQRLIKSGASIRYFRGNEQLRDVVTQDLREWLDENGIAPVDPCFVDPTKRHHDLFAAARRQLYFTSETSKKVETLLSRFCDLDFVQNDEALKAAEPPPEDPLKDFYREDHSKKLEKALIKFRWQNAASTEDASEEGSIVTGLVHGPSHIRHRVLTLVGDRGCGKSALLTNWVPRFSAKHPDIFVTSHYVGAVDSACSLRHMLSRLTRLIRHHFGLKSHEISATVKDPDLALRYQKEAFGGALSLGPMVIIIDGLDSLSNFSGKSADKIKSMSWLPDCLPRLCRIVVTTVVSDLTHSSLAQRSDVYRLRLDTLVTPSVALEDDKERMEMLVETFGQKLSDEFWDNFPAWPLRSSALAQVMIAREFHTAGPTSFWAQEMEDLLETATIRDLFTKVMRRWVKMFSWIKLTTVEKMENAIETDEEDKIVPSEWEGWIADALAFLALSRDGLPLDTILTLLHESGYSEQAYVSYLDWFRFQNSALAVIDFKDGIVCFTHPHFKQITEHLFLGSVLSGCVETRAHKTDRPSYIDVRCRMHGLLGDMHLKQENFVEAVYHLDRASRFDEVAHLLVKPEVFTQIIDRESEEPNGCIECLHDFREIWEASDSGSEDCLGLLKSKLETCLSLKVEGLPTAEDIRGTESPIINKDQSADNVELPTVQVPTILLDFKEILMEENVDQTNNMEKSEEDLNVKDKKESQEFWKKVQFGWKASSFLTTLDFGEAGFSVLIGLHDVLEKHLLPGAIDLLHKARLETDISLHPMIASDQYQRSQWLNKALHTVGMSLSFGESDDPDSTYPTQTARVLRGRCHLLLSEIASKSKDESEEIRLLDCVAQDLKLWRSVTLEADYSRRMAVLHHRNRAYSQCHDEVSRSMELQQRWTGSTHITTAELFIQMALLLADRDWLTGYNPLKAEAYLRRAQKVQEQCLPPDNLQVALTMDTLAKILVFDKSRISLREAYMLSLAAFDIRVKKLGVDHPFTQTTQATIRQLEITKPRPPGPRILHSRPVTAAPSLRSHSSISSSSITTAGSNEDLNDQLGSVYFNLETTLPTNNLARKQSNNRIYSGRAGAKSSNSFVEDQPDSNRPMTASVSNFPTESQIAEKSMNVRFTSNENLSDTDQYPQPESVQTQQLVEEKQNRKLRAATAPPGRQMSNRTPQYQQRSFSPFQPSRSVTTPHLLVNNQSERFLIRTAPLFNRGGRPKSCKSLSHLVTAANSSIDSLLRMTPDQIRTMNKTEIHYRSAWYLIPNLEREVSQMESRAISRSGFNFKIGRHIGVNTQVREII